MITVFTYRHPRSSTARSMQIACGLVCGTVLFWSMVAPKLLAQEPERKAGGVETPKPKSPISADLLQSLVERLSDREFAVRENATEELLQVLSDSDLPQLEAKLQSLEDLEAKVRLGGIVAKIKQERLHSQVRSFMRSRDPTQTYGFEGWTTFSKYSGTSRNAKLLFLKLLDTYPDLVETKLESKQDSLVKTKAIASAVFEKVFTGKQSSVEDGLALLYCVNASEELFSKELEPICLRIFRTAPFSPFIRETQSRKALEMMLVGWAKRTTDTLPGCLQLLIETEISQSREIAISFLDTKMANVDHLTYVLSMSAMYRFGGRTDLPKIMKWLDDNSVCFPDQPQNVVGGNPPGQNPAFDPYTVERRDIALLVAMRINGDDPLTIFPLLVTHPLRGFRVDSIALPATADSIRSERVQQWKETKKPETDGAR